MIEGLRLVPGCERGEAALAVEPLGAGSVNRTLLVTSRAGRFVLRIAGADAARLGADRAGELRCQRLAAAAGLAPAIVAHSADLRIVVAEYVPGRSWSGADFASGAAVVRLGARLRELHSLPCPAAAQAAPFDLRATLERLAAAVPCTAAAERERVAAILTRARAGLAAGPGPRRAALLHLDLHPENIVEGERLVFLDWEYAAWGDPALDLASMAAIEPALDPHLELLRRASGLAASLAPGQLLGLRTAFQATHWLWYRARRLAGAPSAAERAAEAALLERLEGATG